MERTTEKLLLLFACALLVPTPTGGNDCERMGTTLNCVNAKGRFLREVASPADIVHMYVADSDASQLSPDDFATFPDLESLVILNTYLVLSENFPVSSQFGELPSLQEINLSGNKISFLEPGVFQGLRALRSISLRENNISAIRRGVFNYLRHLETLDLSFNHIVKIETDAFAELPSLEVLDLSANRLGEGFEPGHLNTIPRQCTVCRPRSGSDVCTGHDISLCNGSRIIDDLFTRFPIHNLILKSNPICKRIGAKSRNIASSVNNTDISSDTCKVNFEGNCFVHESRRFFLAAVCKESYISNHNISTPPNSIPPNSNSEKTEETEFDNENADDNADQKCVNNNIEYANVGWNKVCYIIIGCLLGMFIVYILPHAAKYVSRRISRLRNKPNQTTSTQDDFQEQFEQGRQTLLEYLRSGGSPGVLDEIVTHQSDRREEVFHLLDREGGGGGKSDEVEGCRLHAAVREGDAEKVKALLDDQRGPAENDINKKDGEGKWPLLLAVEGRHLPIVKLLLERGADTGMESEDGQTVLHLASSNDVTDIIHLLLTQGGMDARQKDKVGYTPLHYAARKGHLEVVKRLLKASSSSTEEDINAKSEKKNSPLHQAAKGGHMETMALLVGSGGDLRALNARNLTPLQVAKERSQSFIEELRRFLTERNRIS